jgi:hypothetical protein
MACDDEIIPLQARIETVADDTYPEAVVASSRCLHSPIFRQRLPRKHGASINGRIGT